MKQQSAPPLNRDRITSGAPSASMSATWTEDWPLPIAPGPQVEPPQAGELTAWL